MFSFMSLKMWAVTGVVAIILGTAGYIDILQGKNERLKESLRTVRIEFQQAKDTNSVNQEAIAELKELLQECSKGVAASEEREKIARERYERELEQVQKQTSKDVQSVRRDLSGESCTSVPLPSDTNRLLMERTANQDGN